MSPATMPANQRDVDPRTLKVAGYMILITSLDALAFPLRTLVWLYRVRWQIELTFKRLKSILRLDRSPAKDLGSPEPGSPRIFSSALLIEDTTAETAAFSPCEPLKRPSPLRPRPTRRPRCGDAAVSSRQP